MTELKNDVHYGMTRVKVGCYATVLCEKEIWVSDPDDFDLINAVMQNTLTNLYNCRDMGPILYVEEV